MVRGSAGAGAGAVAEAEAPAGAGCPSPSWSSAAACGRGCGCGVARPARPGRGDMGDHQPVIAADAEAETEDAMEDELPTAPRPRPGLPRRSEPACSPSLPLPRGCREALRSLSLSLSLSLPRSPSLMEAPLRLERRAGARTAGGCAAGEVLLLSAAGVAAAAAAAASLASFASLASRAAAARPAPIAEPTPRMPRNTARPTVDTPSRTSPGTSSGTATGLDSRAGSSEPAPEPRPMMASAEKKGTIASPPAPPLPPPPLPRPRAP